MNRNVLIVDDDPSIRALVRGYLTDPYTTCSEAVDGAEGVQEAGRCQPDAIVLDMSMPKMNGFEVCQSLKADPATRRIPILFLTSESEIPDKVRGLDLGAADYITKPFDGDELKARVRSVLRFQRELRRSDDRAARDEQTGLFNRAYLTQRLEADLAASRRRGQPLACCVTAVDDPAGDGTVMRAVANSVLSVLRKEDVACRYDERMIAVLGFASDRAAALVLGQRVQAAVAVALAATGAGAPLAVNVGVALSHYSIGDSLLWHAAEALRQAPPSDRGAIQFGGELTELHLADRLVN